MHLILSFCSLFHMLFTLIYLTSTIGWYTGVKAVMDEDKELSFLLFSFFPFPTLAPKLLITLTMTPVLTELLLFLYNETLTAIDLHQRVFISRSLTVLLIKGGISNCIIN